VPGPERSLAQLREGRWELVDERGRALAPVPTPEDKACALPSIYALTKHDTERLALVTGRAYGIPTVALRFFNTFGPRQALSNPYTGVLAIFAARLLNNRAPLINEDGLQRRDFVSVHDVARACHLAMEVDEADGVALNVGSGRSFTIIEVAERLAAVLGRGEVAAEVTGKYRFGDIRHCFADLTRTRQVLGYEPETTFEEGVEGLAGWLEGRGAIDRVEDARAELASLGLAL
jgi:dTDP-L-rhamnose 4-epimerase